MITREQALDLLYQHIKAENLRKHCLATEAIMRRLAERLGYDPDRWGIAGLVHDLDFEETRNTPEKHGLLTLQILRDAGVDDEEMLEAIKAHNAEALGLERKGDFQHALAAAETITGLIVATALVYPDKKLASVKPSSITKRMKKKDFARNVSREVIMECEKFGMSLNEFAELALRAMQEIADQLGL